MTANGQHILESNQRELNVVSSTHNDKHEARPGDVWLATGNGIQWKFFVIPIRKLNQPFEHMWECAVFEAPGNAVSWNMCDVTDWLLPRPDWNYDQAQLICRA